MTDFKQLSGDLEALAEEEKVEDHLMEDHLEEAHLEEEAEHQALPPLAKPQSKELHPET